MRPWGRCSFAGHSGAQERSGPVVPQGPNLSGAELGRANLSGARFEPTVVPPANLLLGVTGLDTLQWNRSPQALVLLRNAFKDAGMRQQERQTTLFTDEVVQD